MRYLFVAIFALLQSGGFCQSSLNFDDLLDLEDITGAQIAIDIRTEDGKSVYSKNQQLLLMPGSTMKLVTTLSAIDVLGPDFKFETKLYYSGHLNGDGSLYGDIIIMGSGDPSLGSPEDPSALRFGDLLKSFHLAIKKAGIKCITGDVISHYGKFDSWVIHDSWAWDDLTNYYASGAFGLNVHENFYRVYFNRSAESDSPTSISQTAPLVPGLKIKNYVLTGSQGSGDNAYVYGDPYSNNRTIKGTIPPGTDMFSIKAAIPDPGLFLAYHVKKDLRLNGIAADGLVKTVHSYSSNLPKLLYTHRSAKLSELVRYANQVSNNLYCEAFLRAIGVEKLGKASFETGVQAIESLLDSIHQSTFRANIEDGSGLSWRNRISAESLNKQLIYHSKAYGIDAMKRYLPKAGSEGSVANFLKNNKQVKSAWFKSGSINGVLCYSGFVILPKNRMLFITVMSNGHSCSNAKLRLIYEQIIERSTELN